MAASACLPPCPVDRRACSAVGIAVIAFACFAVCAIGGATSVEPARDWYPTLAKPTWTPPAWAFGPVWTALYAAMAVAAALVWLRRDDCDPCGPMGAFAVQLAANLAWTLLFFGMRSPWLGLLDGLLLWAAVGNTTYQFFQVRPLAGWLFVPYWIWVTFAVALNASIAVMSS